MNETDKRLDKLEIRLNKLEKGLEEMGVMAICKYCGDILEMDIEKHIKVMGSSEPELNGWYCNDDCYDLFVEDWNADKSRILPI